MKWKQTVNCTTYHSDRPYYDSVYVAADDDGVLLPREHVNDVIVIRVKRKFFVSNNAVPSNDDDLGPFPTLRAATAAATVLIQAGGFHATSAFFCKESMLTLIAYNSLTRWRTKK